MSADLTVISWAIARRVRAREGDVALGQGRSGALSELWPFFFIFYRFVDALASHAFRGLPPLGAEHGMLPTAGFGDIVRLDPMARNIVNLESIVGQP